VPFEPYLKLNETLLILYENKVSMRPKQVTSLQFLPAQQYGFNKPINHPVKPVPPSL
jgi:hypothetical protein